MSDDGTVTVTCYTGSEQEIEIPATLGGMRVTAIGEGAFAGNDSLTAITVPVGVTKIGERAFAGCSNLTSVNLPDTVETLGAEAFSGCTVLTSIMLPDSLKEIGENLFEGCLSVSVECKAGTAAAAYLNANKD